MPPQQDHHVMRQGADLRRPRHPSMASPRPSYSPSTGAAPRGLRPGAVVIPALMG
jgi:hypothetical protein